MHSVRATMCGRLTCDAALLWKKNTVDHTCKCESARGCVSAVVVSDAAASVAGANRAGRNRPPDAGHGARKGCTEAHVSVLHDAPPQRTLCT